MSSGSPPCPGSEKLRQWLGHRLDSGWRSHKSSPFFFKGVRLSWASEGLLSPSSIHDPLPISVLRLVRAHGPSRTALQASVQPKSPKAAPRSETPPAQPRKTVGHPRASAHALLCCPPTSLLTQHYGAEWAQGGGEGYVLPSCNFLEENHFL